MSKCYTELELIEMAKNDHLKELIALQRKQNRTDSIKETICTVGIGYFVSLLVQFCICHFYGLSLTIGDNATITGIFTVTSLLRVYIIRRIFEGSKP